jgi:hypothetical protein
MPTTLAFFVRFALFLGVEWAFVYWVPSIACRPLSHLAQETLIAEPVPTGATCYTVEHGHIVFRYYRPFTESPVPYLLTAGVLAAVVAIFFWPSFWMKSEDVPADHKIASPADPYAASKAATFRQLFTTARHRFGLGPLILFGAFAVLGVMTAIPPLAQYQSLLFVAVAPAALAAYVGRRRENLPRKRGDRDM